MRNKLFWSAVYAGCVSSIVICFTAGGAMSLRAQEAQAASVFFVQSTTPAQIQNKYENGKVRILIVPGHQPDAGGTKFGSVYERDIIVDMADALAVLLARNPHYDVMIARTKKAWHPILQSYFDTQVLDILAFERSQALQMENHLADGSILPEADQVYHNTTLPYAALQLYGINKWTSDNEYDITLHLHVNDYTGHRAKSIGVYDGFTIYVPDHQYSNAAASKAVGEAIAARLNAYHATSTLPQEGAGVVPDQWLIATGSNNSAAGAALLIEYGYIYEPQFQKPSVRKVAIADYAYQTYLGLQDFFEDSVSPTFGSISFPYTWNRVNAKKGESGPGIYALQAALRHLKFYPPPDKSFSECPVSGKAGPCTRAAVRAYQSAHGLSTTGQLGPRTRAALERDLTAP